MGIQERKERERSEMQEKILETAADIMKSEGIGAISIRKIANKIEYSPAIVYHYFKDKEDIINHLVALQYRKFLDVLSLPDLKDHSSKEALRQNLHRFINYATGMGEEYKIIMLSESPAILTRTSVLHQGSTIDKPAVALLRNTLKKIMANSGYDESRLEILVQVIWASTFGLILRLIIEKVDKGQKERLTDAYIDFVLSALQETDNRRNL